MSLFLYDDQKRSHFYPLTLTRSVAQLRIGILTIQERWELFLDQKSQIITESHISPSPSHDGQSHLYINARVLPSKDVLSEIRALTTGEGLFKENDLIAFKSEEEFVIGKPKHDDLIAVQSKCEMPALERVTDLFSRNSEVINFDFEALNTSDSAAIPEHCTLLGSSDSIYIHPTAKVYASSFNTSDGPIYIGKNAVVMEGSMVRGPFAMCDSSTLKLGTKVYGATTIGPHSKVGGEVSNSVILGYSNKGHDGFMGNSIIGEWCNLGADTNTSNLKNNYSNVRVWNYSSKTMEDTGLTFCGLIMGDHSKCSINTMFNTGTVVGVNANIFGSGFPPKFVPSFSWGGGDSMATYDFNKAMETADKVCARRKIQLSDFQKNMLKKVFETSKVFRS